MSWAGVVWWCVGAWNDHGVGKGNTHRHILVKKFTQFSNLYFFLLFYFFNKGACICGASIPSDGVSRLVMRDKHRDGYNSPRALS